VEDEARGMVTAQVQQVKKLSTEERHKLLQLEVDAKQAQRDAEERAQRAETDAHQHCLESEWPLARTQFPVNAVDSVVLPYPFCHFLQGTLNFACSLYTA